MAQDDVSQQHEIFGDAGTRSRGSKTPWGEWGAAEISETWGGRMDRRSDIPHPERPNPAGRTSEKIPSSRTVRSPGPAMEVAISTRHVPMPGSPLTSL